MGGPPVRGTKLMAWRTPTSSESVSDGFAPSASSGVGRAQKRLRTETTRTLEAVAADVRAGLAETVGVAARLNEGERASVVVELPALPRELTPEYVARAIDMENVEAWCDAQLQVHVGVSPWYTTKEVDQVVLSITKVAHVLLGRHASDTLQDGGRFWQRWLRAALEIAELQKRPHRN